MKVTRSPTGLVVRAGPGLLIYTLGAAALYPLWVLLGGGSISGEQLTGSLVVPPVSIALAAFFFEVAEFKFSPVTHSLHWWKRGALKRSGGTIALSDIEEILVTARPTRDDGYVLHNVWIIAPRITLQLRRGASTGDEGRRVATAIVQYLAELGYHPRLVIEESDTWASTRPERRSRIIIP